MTDEQRLQAIRDEREAEYGNVMVNMDALGECLTGLLEVHFGMELPSMIPGYIVAMFMVQLKALRVAGPGYKDDNYDDLINYAKIAKQVDHRKPKKP